MEFSIEGSGKLSAMFGQSLGKVWAMFGESLGKVWAKLGQSWGKVGAKFGQSSGYVRANGEFCRKLYTNSFSVTDNLPHSMKNTTYIFLTDKF